MTRTRPLRLERGTRLPYRLGWSLCRFFLTIFLGLRCDDSRAHLPSGSCILASNHKSYLDPPTVGSSIHKPIHYLAKEELFAIPLFGRVLRSVGALPIRRRRPTPGQLEACLRAVRAGGCLLVFPEGTRIQRRGFGRPRQGVAFLARHTGVPVVPVYTGGTLKWRWALLRRRPVRVRFGRPIVLGDDEDDRAFSRRVLGAIAALADPEDAEASDAGSGVEAQRGD